MDLVTLARKLRPFIVKGASFLDDKEISQAPFLCQELLGTGSIIKAGTRINWHGNIKKSTIDLWDRPELWPDQNPNGWEELPYREGVRIIPTQLDAESAFHPGELGWWGDVLMESILPTDNVYTPDQYPSGWEKLGDSSHILE